MTLKKLINKGLLTVYGPLVSFVVACGIVTNWLAGTILNHEETDFIVAMAVFAAILLGWIWWSYKIVKWKCWAFSQIQPEDCYELYEKAIEVGLIWPTGSFFNKTEIWTKTDKEKWHNLKPEIREIFEIGEK